MNYWGARMINLNKLHNINYLQQKQKALIIARRSATEQEQKAINIELSIIYNAKYKALQEARGNGKANNKNN